MPEPAPHAREQEPRQKPPAPPEHTAQRAATRRLLRKIVALCRKSLEKKP